MKKLKVLLLITTLSLIGYNTYETKKIKGEIPNNLDYEVSSLESQIDDIDSTLNGLEYEIEELKGLKTEVDSNTDALKGGWRGGRIQSIDLESSIESLQIETSLIHEKLER